jgi:hypothetical protein
MAPVVVALSDREARKTSERLASAFRSHFPHVDTFRTILPSFNFPSIPVK